MSTRTDELTSNQKAAIFMREHTIRCYGSLTGYLPPANEVSNYFLFRLVRDLDGGGQEREIACLRCGMRHQMMVDAAQVEQDLVAAVRGGVMQ